MYKGQKLDTGIMPWVTSGLQGPYSGQHAEPHRQCEGWREQADSCEKQHPTPGTTGHVFYKLWEPGTPSTWGCHITPLPSRAVTASMVPVTQ